MLLRHPSLRRPARESARPWLVAAVVWLGVVAVAAEPEPAAEPPPDGEPPPRVVRPARPARIQNFRMLAPLRVIAPPRQQQPVTVKVAGVDLEEAMGQILLDAIENVQELLAPAPEDPDGARQAEMMRKQQVRQQAKQMEQFFQPILQTELEVIRQACPSLAVEDRREVLAAGKAAVKKVAADFAAIQLAGELGRKKFDVRQEIRRPLVAILETGADAAEFATYQEEERLRVARRAEAARIRIVAKLDATLDLTAAQRDAILAALEAGWEEAWVRELDDQGGMVINGFRPAPDFATDVITPHLDPGQRTEWDRWRTQAGWKMMGEHFGWQFDGQGIQHFDEWWSP